MREHRGAIGFRPGPSLLSLEPAVKRWPLGFASPRTAMKTGPRAFETLRPAWSIVHGHIRGAIRWGAAISWRSAWYLPATPEWKRYIAKVERFRQAIEAYEAGEEGRIWALVEEELGRSPDELLRSVLEQHYLPYGPEVEPCEYFWLVDHHRRRLKASNRNRWYRDLSDRTYHSLKKTAGCRLMRSLEGYAESPRMRLRMDLPGALMQAEAEGCFEAHSFLLGEVEDIIIEANRLLRHTRKPLVDEEGDVIGDKIISSIAQGEDGEEFDLFDVFDDSEAFDAYAGIEDEDLVGAVVARAGLSPVELEIYLLCRQGLEADEIANIRGTVRDTVYVQLRNIRLKLEAVA